MAGLKSIRLDIAGARDLALISAADDSVWLVVSLRWYDLATLFWYWLTPTDKRARVGLTLFDGAKVTAYAVRVATKHARIRGFR